MPWSACPGPHLDSFRNPCVVSLVMFSVPEDAIVIIDAGTGTCATENGMVRVAGAVYADDLERRLAAVMFEDEFMGGYASDPRLVDGNHTTIISMVIHVVEDGHFLLSSVVIFSLMN